MALKLSSCVKTFSSMPSKDKFELWLGEWIYQWGGRCLHTIFVTIALLPFDTTVVPAHAHFRRCSAPASHNFGITRYPPSNKINGLQFQYRVKTLVLDKLFALGRDVCETRQLRQTRPVRSLRTLEFLRLFIGKIYPYCRDQSNLTSCLVSLFKLKLWSIIRLV